MYLEFTAGLQAGRKRWVDLLHTSVCKVDPSEELTLSKPIANPKPTQGRHRFKNQIQTKTGQLLGSGWFYSCVWSVL